MLCGLKVFPWAYIIKNVQAYTSVRLDYIVPSTTACRGFGPIVGVAMRILSLPSNCTTTTTTYLEVAAF